ncbi:MAG: hypothetical protein K2N18_03370, partial [Clostridia bacterium]|nr:hypothetical protein [Clostridia bacterium]
LDGVVSFPIMKLITSVGALVVVCAAFLVLAFLGLLPSIRRNVTYTAASKKERRVKPSRRAPRGENSYATRQRVRGESHRIGAAAAPVITDFSQISKQGDESLYVVDVAGDPMPQKRGKRAKGADGYRPISSFNPLYPNQNGGYEDEMRIQPIQNGAMRASGDEYTSRGVARDILFGQEPSAEVMSRFETASNPRDALSNVSPSYDAVRRGEMRNRFSNADSSDTMREEFIRRYRENGDNQDNGYTQVANGYPKQEEDKSQSISEKLDFYALKADRERTFAENPIQLEFGADSNEEKSEPVKKEVVKPTRVMRHPDSADAINSTIRKAESAVNSNVNTGMLGALNRAAAGENAPQQPQAPKYEKPVFENPVYEQSAYNGLESEAYD